MFFVQLCIHFTESVRKCESSIELAISSPRLGDKDTVPCPSQCEFARMYVVNYVHKQRGLNCDVQREQIYFLYQTDMLGCVFVFMNSLPCNQSI